MTDRIGHVAVGSGSASAAYSLSRALFPFDPFQIEHKNREKVLDFGIQISSNGDSLHVAVWRQEAGHPVIRQVNAISLAHLPER